MPYTFDPEQQALAEAVAQLCARECGTREKRDELTDHGRWHHSPRLYQRCADAGWLGIGIPEEYGGSGGGLVDRCVFIEETARGMAPVGGYATSAIVSGPVLRFGSEQQRKEILSAIAGGRVQAIAMTEPGAGSDVSRISCRARRGPDGFVVNGQKTFISNAHIAENILLIARTSGEPGAHDGLTMLIVPADSPGIEVRPIATMAGPGEVNDVYFTDCVVPEANVVGQVDGAWMQLMAGLNHERLYLAAVMLGIARRAFDDALGYIKERHQFGKPIGNNQALRHRVADLATEIECCSLLTYDVAAKVDASPDDVLAHMRQASFAKLKVTETAKQVTLEGMQMLGGYGYTREYDMEGLVRASLVSTIYGGTSEIQRDIIAKSYGL